MSDLHSLLRKGNTETVNHFLKSCGSLPKNPGETCSLDDSLWYPQSHGSAGAQEVLVLC